MDVIREYPVGFKAGLMDIKRIDKRGVVVPIRISEDLDVASAECYDWNLYAVGEKGTLAEVETPLFKTHYLGYLNGKFVDASYFYYVSGELPESFALNKIFRKGEVPRRSEARINFGSWVVYRLFEDDESKILMGIIPYTNAIWITFTRYGDKHVGDTNSLIIEGKINKSPLDSTFSEIFHRERYALETILENLSQSF